MKIFIDSNEANFTSLGTLYRVPEVDGSIIWLPIIVKNQLKSRWCWAAIASAVGQYYQVTNIGQAELAQSLLIDFTVENNRYSQDDIADQNVNFKLDVALKKVRCFSHWTIGKPSFERVKFEINQGRPFGVRLEWFKGGAHYILVKGYDESNGRVLIEDSLHGASTHIFNEFPKNYKDSGAVWTETFWTINNHKKTI